MATSNSPTHYVGPSPTGLYYYANPTTGDINELSVPPSPDQLNAWQADNPKVGTTEQTQSTPAQLFAGETQTISSPPVFKQDQLNQDLTASTNPGAAAPNDDNFGLANTTSGTAAQLNVGTEPSGLIKPQPNILDQYASYTYSLSWYLLTPAQYSDLPNSPKINIGPWSLLAQSGGAAVQQQGVVQQGTTLGQTSTLATPNRNKYFSVDYYLDNLEITTQITGSGPSQIPEMSFVVTEPNGLTLLANLNNAVRDFYQDASTAPLKAYYCMVVRFYGWDANGNLITDPTSKQGSNGVTPNNTNAVIVRYYPFIIADFKFKYAGKGVEYEIKGWNASIQYGKSSGTASLPYGIELTGTTVSDVLSGNGAEGVIRVEDGRASTPAPISVGIGGTTPTELGVANQNQADTINLLAAGNMGA